LLVVVWHWVSESSCTRVRTRESNICSLPIQLIVVAIVLTLIIGYTPKDQIAYFYLIQSSITTLALVTYTKFPGFVGRVSDLPVIKFSGPFVFALEVIGVFLVGANWEYYHSVGSSYSGVYPTLLAFKIIEVVFFYLSLGDK
jgi:hypothetical protein